MSRRSGSEDSRARAEIARAIAYPVALDEARRHLAKSFELIVAQIDDGTDPNFRRRLLGYMTGKLQDAHVALEQIAKSIAALRSIFNAPDKSAPRPAIRVADRVAGGAAPEPGEPAPIDREEVIRASGTDGACPSGSR